MEQIYEGKRSITSAPQRKWFLPYEAKVNLNSIQNKSALRSGNTSRGIREDGKRDRIAAERLGCESVRHEALVEAQLSKSRLNEQKLATASAISIAKTTKETLGTEVTRLRKQLNTKNDPRPHLNRKILFMTMYVQFVLTMYPCWILPNFVCIHVVAKSCIQNV